jgi:2-keto-3-deoxy-L-rhamnonate aldolase RhmA
VFVGPNDLAVSAGLESGYEGRDPAHRRMIERIAESAREHHVTAGIMCGTPEVAKQWHDVGYQMLALDADTRLLMTATEQIAERAKKLISPKS